MAPKRPLITYGKQQHPKKRRTLPPSFWELNNNEVSASMAFAPSSFKPEPLIPKRPNSQKAATMAVEPDQDSISSLCIITGCDPDTARRFLRVKQNNVDQAANALLDGEDISKLEQSETWDESAWAADREGNQNLHPLGASAAPTRGNSPAPSLGLQQPTNKHDEDSDLARALAMSRGDVDMPFVQESGVVKQDGSEVKFGPATRDQYDPAQWSMVPASQEIVPDVPAERRKYDGEGPRFLKHLPDGDYTPNLITICHSIAKLREAFYLRNYVKHDYGSEPDWWRGHPIPMPRIVHTSDGSSAEPDSDKYDELISEVQRLTAFLDCSQRSYASIGGITQSDMIKNNEASSSRPDTLMELFLQCWMEAAGSRLGAPDDFRSLFTTIVGTTAAAGMSDTNMRVVDLTVKPREGTTDLLELLDNHLWDTDPNDEEMPDNYIEEPADFIVIRVQHSSPDATRLGLEIPASLPIDKYLKENVDSTRDIRYQMMQGKRRVAKIDEIEMKLKSLQHPKNSTQVEARQVLNHAIGHFSGKNRKDAEDADMTNSASIAHDEPEHYPDVAKKLEQLAASIDKKLEVLAEEREKTQKAVSELSKASVDLKFPETHPRYTLRGVATKPNITYVLSATEGEDKDITNSDEDTTPPGHQWWRIAYEVSGSSASIIKVRSGDFDVLRAVELEHSSALLVYGNEEACDRQEYYTAAVPDALREFVEKDNHQFQQELEDANLPSYSIINDDIPRKSIERTSMDSLKVAGDSDEERLLDDDALTQQHHGFGLGYDVKSVGMDGAERPRTPVDEIHLGPEESILPNSTNEMVQKPDHQPFVPRPGTAGDTAMGGMESQDDGVGGASHVEDAGAGGSK
ncbi:hypothetical protein PRZ48_007278 [Zasmidium cellare]|uniref:UBA domain-containing protein n=1 Tax=Zasmidium cellare TaxID=395010 RepID=A0ABR0EIW4_ZASCE|nr:hypothetical protein PRZ48_007278 [Zasmidium cellare]